MKRIFLLLAFLIVLGRIFITPRLTNIPTFEGTYETLAHMISGGFIFIGVYDWHSELGPSRFYFWLGIMLGVYELMFFVVQKLG